MECNIADGARGILNDQRIKPALVDTVQRADLHAFVLSRDPLVLQRMQRLLPGHFRITMLGDVNDIERQSNGVQPDLLIMDWSFATARRESNPCAAMAQFHAAYPAVPIFVLPDFADSRATELAQRLSIRDISFERLPKAATIVGGRASDMPDDCQAVALDAETSFVRCSGRMKEIESQCALVARTDIPVLILGESGTGKEVVAKLIYKMSARSQQHFLKVNCAAMPSELLESELFGYEQGAFTGAVRSKPGKFELCDNGTIFLDEIGEMSCALQAKLLQVLQDGRFSRLGSRSTVKVNVRVVAATNIDIKESIGNKSFREDLYYRLNGFTIKMPPLRERAEEVPLLSRHFMHRVVAKYDCEPLPISPAFMQALSTYHWPGNLRELENVIKRYMILGDEQVIINELDPSPRREPGLPDSEDPGVSSSLKHLVRNLKGNAESAAIAQTLVYTGWNRKAAASDLQISYKALLYKIKQYNLTPPPKPPARTFSEFR